MAVIQQGLTIDSLEEVGCLASLQERRFKLSHAGISSLFLLDSWNPLSPLIWRCFDSGANTEHGKSQAERSDVHAQSQWCGHEYDSEQWVANHQELSVELGKDND